MSGVTTNDLAAVIGTIGSNRSILKTIYCWPERLSEFLRRKIDELKPEQFEAARLDIPDLETGIPDEADRLSSLSEREIVRARAWLHANSKLKKGKADFRLQPDVRALVDEIYPSAIGKHSVNFWVPEELCIGPGHRVVTEFPRARVVSERDERMSTATIKTFVRALSTLRLLAGEGLRVPAIDPDDLKGAVVSADTKPGGRYRTLPHEVVFTAIRKGIEFALEYGDDLVDSYLAAVEAAASAGESIAVYFGAHDIRSVLRPSTLRLGVDRWCIEPFGEGSSSLAGVGSAEYHRLLRLNVGLYESIRVLFGGIQIVVGTLMARRQGELVDLPGKGCLDADREFLIFRNRKSGIGGMRRSEARPIPPIAVKLIGMLERLQDGLVRSGSIPSHVQLFSTPRRVGGYAKRNFLTQNSRKGYSESIDFFCDWMETPRDRYGKRYYIRQHQLRRFFAMLFFFGGGFGGMETLRWFLGHTDPEHLWNYITEFTPGETIRSVAAEWAAYGVLHGTIEAEMLGAELASHFGTTNFSILEEDALVMFLEDLIEEGRLTVAPEFLDGGQRYRIAVVLKPGTRE
jgi:hypothetical protein